MPIKELLPRTNARDRIFDFDARDRTRLLVQTLGLILPGEAIEEKASSGNTFHLAPGNHVLPLIENPGTLVVGLADTTIESGVDIESTDCAIKDIRFVGTRNPLVTVGASAVVVFRGCVFERPATSPMVAGERYVTVEAGGRAVFDHCIFRGAHAAGNVVNNGGAAANVQIDGCSNRTGVAHVNVTIDSEV